MKPVLFLSLFFVFPFLRAQKGPEYLEVEVTWQTSNGSEQTREGQLWLDEKWLHVLEIRDDGTVEPVRFDGRRLTPRSPGDVRLRRDGSHGDHPRFRLDIHNTSRLVHFPEPTLAVLPKEATVADAMRMTLEENPLDREMTTLFGEGDGPDDLLADPDGAVDDSAREGLRLEMDKPGDLRKIPFARIREIRFLRGGDGYQFESYGGRYVQYSRAGRGDEGRVRLRGATFFGDGGREAFDAGGFTRDGSIVLAASLGSFDFLDDTPVRTLGPDPTLTRVPDYYRRTPSLVIYGADLDRIREVVRFPLGVGRASHILFGSDDAIFLLVRPGPHTEAFFQSLSRKQVLGDPLGGVPHSYLFRVSPDRSGWSGA